MDTSLCTSMQVQAVTSVGPGDFSDPMTIVVTPPSDTPSSSSSTVVVAVVVIVVVIIVLCTIASGLMVYICWSVTVEIRVHVQVYSMYGCAMYM